MNENIRLIATGTDTDSVFFVTGRNVDEFNSYKITAVPKVTGQYLYFDVTLELYTNAKLVERLTIAEIYPDFERIGGNSVKRYKIDSDIYLSMIRTIDILSRQHEIDLENIADDFSGFRELIYTFESGSCQEFYDIWDGLEDLIKAQDVEDIFYKNYKDLFERSISEKSYLILAIPKRSAKSLSVEDVAIYAMREQIRHQERIKSEMTGRNYL